MKNIGIDVAKDKHRASVIDENKKKLVTFDFENSHLGLSEFKKRISPYGPDFKIGLESTGVYSYGLVQHLKQEYGDIALINPKRIKAHRKSLGYEYKTDKIDAHIIADYVKERDLSNNLLPEKYPQLKQLCRTRIKLLSQETRLKNRITGDLHILFPEYENCFDSIHCKSSLEFLKVYLDPEEIASLSEEKIKEILMRGCKSITLMHAKRIKLAAKNSFGVKKGGLDIEIRLAIEDMEVARKQITLLEKLIKQQMENIADPFEGLKGMSKVYVAGIIAESGDISYFKNRYQYYNFTGLVPRFAQSGKFVSTNNRMSKCGSSYLRHYLMQAAMSVVKYNAHFKKIFYQKHFLEKKKKHQAYTCVAKKLCYITFKLLKTNQQFCPEKLAH